MQSAAIAAVAIGAHGDVARFGVHHASIVQTCRCVQRNIAHRALHTLRRTCSRFNRACISTQIQIIYSRHGCRIQSQVA